MIATDERVTTQVIILIKRYERILSNEAEKVDGPTLRRVILDLKNELYKYSPSATLKLEDKENKYGE